MGGFFSRMSNVVKAKANSIADAAENPAETLDYSYEQQLQQLQNVRRGIADVLTSEKRLELQAAQLQQANDTLQSQAKQALSAGREDLARTALTRSAATQQQLQALSTQIADLKAQEQKLVDIQTKLQTKIETFRTQKETIKAQYQAAQAQVKIGESVTGLSEEMADMGMAIDRAKDKTDKMQARAGAIDDLIDSGVLQDATAPAGDDIQQQLNQLSAGAGVDAQIAAMKQQLGIAAPQPPAGQLPPPDERR